MKRVKAACICQTLHFMMKEEADRDFAAQQVKAEVASYKKGLQDNHVQYRIVEEADQPDGSVVLKVIKQYNNSPVGDYLAES